MKRHIITLLLLLLACGAWAQDTFYYKGGKKYPLSVSKVRNAVETYKSPNGDYMEASGYLYVKLKSLNDKEVLERTAKSYGLIVIEQNKFMPLWFVLKKENSTRGKSLDIANSFYETGLFEECAPDLAMEGREISYDPEIAKQWGLYNFGENPIDSPCVKNVDIKVSNAWNYSTGKGIIIAIVDEGIDLNHEDLYKNIYNYSYDARTDSQPSKIHGSHGTHCAGIAAAIRNNGIGITGVAPDAKLMSISDELGLTEKHEYTHANGIMWAWKHGADIISCSWRAHGITPMIEEAIDSALVKGREGRGCAVIKSAGNGYTTISYPGNLPGVITVGNIKSNGVKSEDSNRGENMLVCAPGTRIMSTLPDDNYGFYSGTSMAAPHVAGIVALMLERNPNLTVREIREILAQTATKLNTMEFSKTKEYGLWNEYYGYGLVNAYDAVIMSISVKR